MKLRASQIELLRQVHEENVNWYEEYRRKGDVISYRLYTSEYDYTTVTPQMKRLLELGLVKREHTNPSRITMGGVALTKLGRETLEFR